MHKTVGYWIIQTSICILVCSCVGSERMTMKHNANKEQESQRNSRMISRIEGTTVEYPFSFCIIGDTGFVPNAAGDAYFSRALEHMAQLTPKPLFLVNLGDFCGPGTLKRHEQYRKLLDNLSSASICVIGNHELDDDRGEANFKEIIGPANFSFVHGNTLFMAIRSFQRSGGQHGPQREDLAFLDQQLRQKGWQYPVRIVLMHMPPNMNGHYEPHCGEAWAFTHLESEFLQIAKDQHITMVCSAHITGYDRHTFEGMTVLVSGAGGGAVGTSYSGIFPNQPPNRAGFEHFVQLTVEKSGSISGRIYRIMAEGVKEERAYAFTVNSIISDK